MQTRAKFSICYKTNNILNSINKNMTELNKHLGTMHKPTAAVVEYKVPTVEQIRDGIKVLPTKYIQKLRNPEADLSQEIPIYCSYSECPHSTPFELNIDIQGCKWWARKPNHGTDLPGYWKESFTGKYYSRENLWLNHIGHGYDAAFLIVQDNLYTVNNAGLSSVEDDRFRKDSRSLIFECIETHEKHGVPINISKTISSSTTGFTKWGIKAGLSLLDINPVTAMAGGGASYLAGELMKSSGDKILSSVGDIIGDVGKDTFKGALIGSTFEAVGEMAGGIATGSRETGTLFRADLERLNDQISLGKVSFESSYHLLHLAEGAGYDSSCKVCRDD
jgi:hypothetical protein